MSKSALPFEADEDDDDEVKDEVKVEDDERRGEEVAEERECRVHAASTFMYAVRPISDVRRLV